jgi:hypothetical protein
MSIFRIFILPISFGVFLLFSHPVIANKQTELSPRHPVPQCGMAAIMHSNFLNGGKLWKTVFLDDNHIINHYMHNDGRWVLVLVNSIGIGCILQGGTHWHTGEKIKG